jgi:putative transposase
MQTSGGTDWRKRNLPRRAPEFYKGFAFVFWTHTMEARRAGWLSDTFHAQFRELLLHASARYHLMCPVYCLMPDHIHMLWIGLDEGSDQRRAARFLRQHVSPLLLPTKFQKQPHDHVLREQERERNAFQSTCAYIQENPVRKEIVSAWSEYAYTDCMIPAYPELDLRAEDYWTRFWRVYAYVREQNERK